MWPDEVTLAEALGRPLMEVFCIVNGRTRDRCRNPVEEVLVFVSLLVLEQKNPALFRQVLEKYRTDLLSKNEHGEWLRDAGPVTLGQRLISSHFPGGYEAISYERGTWLFHMLRSMLRDCEGEARSRSRQASPDEPFFRALRKVRERYAGKGLSGGRLISGWKPGTGNLWSAQLPDAAAGKWYFQQLFVNGQRRPRTRLWPSLAAAAPWCGRSSRRRR